MQVALAKVVSKPPKPIYSSLTIVDITDTELKYPIHAKIVVEECVHSPIFTSLKHILVSSPYTTTPTAIVSDHSFENFDTRDTTKNIVEMEIELEPKNTIKIELTIETVIVLLVQHFYITQPELTPIVSTTQLSLLN